MEPQHHVGTRGTGAYVLPSREPLLDEAEGLRARLPDRPEPVHCEVAQAVQGDQHHQGEDGQDQSGPPLFTEE